MDRLIVGAVVATLAALFPRVTYAQEFTAEYSGYEELGALNNQTGAILTNGAGSLRLHLDQDAQTATYELTYSGLTTSVTQSHLHFGKVHDSGGIFVFLCTNLGNGPAGTPTCPAMGGTVTGTITAASIVAIPTQNVPAGNFDVLIAALMSDTAYGNVHTTQFPAGEIRGQVRARQDGAR